VSPAAIQQRWRRSSAIHMRGLRALSACPSPLQTASRCSRSAFADSTRTAGSSWREGHPRRRIRHVLGSLGAGGHGEDPSAGWCSQDRSPSRRDRAPITARDGDILRCRQEPAMRVDELRSRPGPVSLLRRSRPRAEEGSGRDLRGRWWPAFSVWSSSTSESPRCDRVLARRSRAQAAPAMEVATRVIGRGDLLIGAGSRSPAGFWQSILTARGLFRWRGRRLPGVASRACTATRRGRGDRPAGCGPIVLRSPERTRFFFVRGGHRIHLLRARGLVPVRVPGAREPSRCRDIAQQLLSSVWPRGDLHFAAHRAQADRSPVDAGGVSRLPAVRKARDRCREASMRIERMARSPYPLENGKPCDRAILPGSAGVAPGQLGERAGP